MVGLRGRQKGPRLFDLPRPIRVVISYPTATASRNVLPSHPDSSAWASAAGIAVAPGCYIIRVSNLQEQGLVENVSELAKASNPEARGGGMTGEHRGKGGDEEHRTLRTRMEAAWVSSKSNVCA